MSERYLLDTNVVSELARARPDPGVVDFVGSLDALWVPASVLYELDRGIRRLPAGRKRVGLERWLDEWLVPPVVVAPFDAPAARAAAKIEETARRQGRPVASGDLFVLAVAMAEGLTVATRNVRDFDKRGVRVFDPFRDARD